MPQNRKPRLARDANQHEHERLVVLVPVIVAFLAAIFLTVA